MSIYKNGDKILNSITAIEEAKVKEIVGNEMTDKGVCTTKVADVPLTEVSIPDGVDGTVFYKISNGIISVSIQGVTASCSVTIPNVPNIYQLSALVNPSGVQCGYAGVPALNTISIVINGSNAGYGSIIINT